MLLTYLQLKRKECLNALLLTLFVYFCCVLKIFYHQLHGGHVLLLWVFLLKRKKKNKTAHISRRFQFYPVNPETAENYIPQR